MAGINFTNEQEHYSKPLKAKSCGYTLLSAVFELEEVIDIVERLTHATEDDVFQYGCEPSEDEDVIDGKRLLDALKNCR